jgi:hypothetical protein
MPVSGVWYEFTKENVDKSPNKPGVYALFKGERLVYYEESHDETIRTRLQKHLAGQGDACTKQATHYKREVCDAA